MTQISCMKYSVFSATRCSLVPAATTGIIIMFFLIFCAFNLFCVALLPPFVEENDVCCGFGGEAGLGGVVVVKVEAAAVYTKALYGGLAGVCICDDEW